MNHLKGIVKQIGESMSLEEISSMMAKVASNGKELTPDDFYDIMTRKTFG